jgi:glycosyltransferase involved in cell wall biosynthesis
MKIFYDYQIFSNQIPGGILRYFVELALQLNKNPEVDARVVSPLIRSPLPSDRRRELPTFGVDVSEIPRLPGRLVHGINSVLFRSYAAIAAPDIVHETYFQLARTAPRSSKIVTTIHDAIPERVPNLFPELEKHRAIRRIVLRRADRVICVSESTRKDLLELYEVDPDRVSVVHLGSSLAPPAEGPVNIGAPFFLHVGARFHYKNFTRLIEAFGHARLHRTHKLVSFTSIPLGAHELETMDRVGVPRDRVIRVGGNDSVLASYYAGAESLVIPSMYEGFGIPLLEAMRCSCPIITSNISSLPEVAGDAALYVDPGDVRSISNAMCQVAASPEIRALLIANGRARALGFSWERCAAETYAIYEGLFS